MKQYPSLEEKLSPMQSVAMQLASALLDITIYGRSKETHLVKKKLFWKVFAVVFEGGWRMEKFWGTVGVGSGYKVFWLKYLFLTRVGALSKVYLDFKNSLFEGHFQKVGQKNISNYTKICDFFFKAITDYTKCTSLNSLHFQITPKQFTKDIENVFILFVKATMKFNLKSH